MHRATSARRRSSSRNAETWGRAESDRRGLLVDRGSQADAGEKPDAYWTESISFDAESPLEDAGVREATRAGETGTTVKP